MCMKGLLVTLTLGSGLSSSAEPRTNQQKTDTQVTLKGSNSVAPSPAEPPNIQMHLSVDTSSILPLLSMVLLFCGNIAKIHVLKY